MAKVVSHLLPQSGPIFTAFATRLDDKTVITGVGLGEFRDGEMYLSDNKQPVAILSGHEGFDRAGSSVGRVAALANHQLAFKMLGDELEHLAGDVCRTSKILDAVHITRTFGFEPD
jgi:hypothetical protein